MGRVGVKEALCSEQWPETLPGWAGGNNDLKAPGRAKRFGQANPTALRLFQMARNEALPPFALARIVAPVPGEALRFYRWEGRGLVLLGCLWLPSRRFNTAGEAAT